MKIGITERGDAGIDLSWYDKLLKVDAAILITKKITPLFIDKVLQAQNQGYKLIIHATCTGLGSTIIEPYVLEYKQQLQGLCTLIEQGFPIEQCVLRIDPIVPTDVGIQCACNVIRTAYTMDLLPDIRIRVSVLDEYKHVKNRFEAIRCKPIYGDNFQASDVQIQNVISTLSGTNLQFECCAEQKLCNHSQFLSRGCISQKDLDLLHIPAPQNMKQNVQNRNGCTCLACKTELLTNRHRCENQCVYCYWKD